MILVLILLVGGTTLLNGCETIERTIKGNPKPAAGAAAAGTGGTATGDLASGGSGAIVGGLMGGLSGGVIGSHIDRQERTRAATAESLAYSEEKGNVVRIEETGLDPQAIRPGETINIYVQYAVITRRGTEPNRVREIRQIYFQGNLVGNPVVEIERGDGTYWSTLPITLPATATPGRYAVVVGVEVYGTLDRWESGFTILQP
jgi:outer membrane lipoprotein SlyB